MKPGREYKNKAWKGFQPEKRVISGELKKHFDSVGFSHLKEFEDEWQKAIKKHNVDWNIPKLN